MEKIKTAGSGVKCISSKSPRRITWGSELATGYDRLKFGFYVKWEDFKILELLDAAKTEAKELHDSVPVSLSPHGDQVFNCHPTGRQGGFAYHLSRADLNIFFSRRKDHDTPNVWVDIGSLSCWSPGYTVIIEEIKKLLRDHNGFIMRNVISEVHLCADFIGQDIQELPIDHSDFWITRANKFGAFQDRQQLTGITLSQTEGYLPKGSKDTINVMETGVQVGQGDIMLRIYDKVIELKHNPSKQSVFSSVWGKEQYNETQVTRVEFQLRREVLKYMAIHSLEDLHRKKAGLWKYCTMEWARLTITPVDRKNRHQDRASIHPWWHAVQTIDFNMAFEGVTRRKVRSAKNIEFLQDMVAGCAITIGTILNRKHDDLEGVIAFGQAALESKLRYLWKEKTDTGKCLFQHKMKKRWSEVWPLGYIPQPV
ncbi:MAG: hypothetical protein KKB30_09990 [Proteobacteria bacterium]|nr:hypothetical protein [Pseudomonadota bacterium]MBU1716381.1 hypothetical protein [Pseudomonadota bacterium]